MKKYKTYEKVLVCIFPFVLLIILYFTARFVIDNFKLPPCLTYVTFGILCPGCGITRSIIALVNGDILLSLRQNIYVFLFLVISIMLYIEFVLKIFGKKFRFPIHSDKLLYVLLIFTVLYTVLRNIIPQLAPI